MIRIVILFFVALNISGCDSSGNATTELEGSWESVCLGGFTAFTIQSVSAVNSSKFIKTFTGNTVEDKVNNYSDTDCVTLVSSIPLEDSTLFVGDPSTLWNAFTIGGEVVTDSGSSAREIDFYDANNNAALQIYQLQDNGNTLYFGTPNCGLAPFPISVTDPLPACLLERPTDINYDFALAYHRVNL